MIFYLYFFCFMIIKNLFTLVVSKTNSPIAIALFFLAQCSF
uniref:Uncharacterized protein n=1 Tax=Rhizophora mucronata TaxID=61149 RepID=A0A2P2PBA4_RHIMU